ncbi:hypothetical protein ACHAPJ_007562 [Fusarium lateritium]
MSFHESAQNITLVDGHILKAELSNGEEWVEAEYDLNEVLGNDEGSFSWGGSSYTDSAEDIYLELEGDSFPILKATLSNSDGETFAAYVNLGDYISNNGGEFGYAG